MTPMGDLTTGKHLRDAVRYSVLTISTPLIIYYAYSYSSAVQLTYLIHFLTNEVTFNELIGVVHTVAATVLIQ